MSLTTRVYLSRLAGLDVFDPLGDPVGRVRDAVVTFGAPGSKPKVIGLLLEVPGRKRVFMPMTRVTSLDAAAVITTGLLNLRRFQQRPTEHLALAELLDRPVTITTPDGAVEATVEDLAVNVSRRIWSVTKVFCRKADPTPARRLSLRRRPGETLLVSVESVSGLDSQAGEQDASLLVAAYEDLRVADLAEAIHDLTPQRRAAVAAALDDERLADVLEELSEDDQVEILSGLDTERAADVLEAMEPDDAADLLAELPEEQQEFLLARMEPDEAAPLRRLLSYAEDTSGGLMTTEPIILGPDAPIAEALALVRQESVPTTLATTVFVCRPPLETPTGRYLGIVHIQRLLREPPHSAVGLSLDRVEPLLPTASVDEVHRHLATYDLVAAPVVDEDGHLVGAVTVDDVLDHILPEDWRDEDEDEDDDEDQARDASADGEAAMED